MARTRVAAQLLLLGLIACGGGLGTKGVTLQPGAIELSPSSTLYEIEEGQVEVGATKCFDIRILNTGESDLTLPEVPTLKQDPCNGMEGNAFSLHLPPTWTGPLALPKTAKADEGIPISVCFKRPAVSCAWTATLTIKSNDPEPTRQVLTVRFKVLASIPNFDAPHVVDFGAVPDGAKAKEELCITNNGLGSLVVTRVSCSGSEGFTFVWPCERADGTSSDSPMAINGKGFVLETCDTEGEAKALSGKCCKTPVEIGRNESKCVEVTYSAMSEDGIVRPAEATCWFVSNDPDSKGDGDSVLLHANFGGKCLQAIENPVDFGSVVVQQSSTKTVTLSVCGDDAVTLSGVNLSPSTDATLFDLDKSGLKLPVLINPGDKGKQFKVTYRPKDVKKNAAGQYEADLGEVLVDSDALGSPTVVKLRGLAINSEQPVCIITAKDECTGQSLPPTGGEVAVQCTLKLDGKNSYSPMGGNVSFQWSVEAPPGSADVFSPSPYMPQVEYTCNLVGNYKVCLKVSDQYGVESQCCLPVSVPVPPGCHVELTWNTPLDPDQTDQCKECGADMDLHVVHPYASGPDLDHDGAPDGFFDNEFDCYWMNTNPQNPKWCPHMNPVDPAMCLPHLDLDDTNGAGPENFTYKAAEPDRCYKVGVHYFDDHQWGPSYPTIRVWIEGQLIYENKDPPKMKVLDMWEVGELCCVVTGAPAPGGVFKPYTSSSGGYRIVPGYTSPL